MKDPGQEGDAGQNALAFSEIVDKNLIVRAPAVSPGAFDLLPFSGIMLTEDTKGQGCPKTGKGDGLWKRD
jgi:hypothetical protein